MTTTDTERDIGTAEVCTDCYYAHHYGAERHTRPATESEENAWLHGHDDRSIMGLTFAGTDHGLEVTYWQVGDDPDVWCEGGEPLADLPEYGARSGDWVCDGISDFTCSNHFYGQTPTADDHVCDECGGELAEDDFSDRWLHVLRFPNARLRVEVFNVGHTPDPQPAACDHCGQSGWVDGITEFTRRSCDGCGSHLGGSRYRLAIHWKKAA